jgi:hypothetical protein
LADAWLLPAGDRPSSRYSTASQDVTWLAFARYVCIGYLGVGPARRKRAAPAQDRENQKTPRDQRISVASGAPSELSKSAEVRLTKSDSISIAYEFRTKCAQSGGLEKSGRRERILRLCRGVAVRRFVCEGPFLLGIFARSQASGECWMRTGWRRERSWDPTFSDRMLYANSERPELCGGHQKTQFSRLMKRNINPPRMCRYPSRTYRRTIR